MIQVNQSIYMLSMLSSGDEIDEIDSEYFCRQMLRISAFQEIGRLNLSEFILDSIFISFVFDCATVKTNEKIEKLNSKPDFGGEQVQKEGTFLGKMQIPAFLRVWWSLACAFS
jgi:hypothetical protein